MNRVFISYASSDQKVAMEVCALLETQGVHCWIAPRDVPAGSKWDEAIVDALTSSGALLLILTSAANESVYVHNEVNFASTAKKPIFTIRLEDVRPSKSLGFYLARHHWTDAFAGPLTENVARVVAGLQASSGGATAAAAITGPPGSHAGPGWTVNWRRPAVRAAAAALFIAAVSGAGWWWYGGRPASRTPRDTPPPISVIIADFSNLTSDATFDRTLEVVIETALEEAAFIGAYDRSGIRALGVDPPAELDERAALEISAANGVGIVLSGSIAGEGRGFRINVQAFDPSTGRVLTTIQESAANRDDVVAATTRAAIAVRRALGDPTSEASQEQGIGALTRVPLDAVHDFAMGQIEMANNRNEEAIKHFSSAVARDPTYAMPLLGLATASVNIGRQQDAERYARQALRLLQFMPDRARYNARGLFYRLTRDYQNCVKEYGSLVATYPADVAAHNNLALCMSILRQFTEARDEMRRAVSLLPKRALYRVNLSLYGSYGSDFETGDAEARQAQELSPSSEYAFVARAFAQLGAGHVSAARDAYDALAAVSDLGASLSASGLADVALYEGRFADAVSILERGAAADLAVGERDRAATKLTALAYARLESGAHDLAAKAAREAVMHSGAVSIRFLAARVLANAGQLARAEELRAQLAMDFQAEPRALAKIVEANVAMVKGAHRESITLLTEANGIFDTWMGHFELGRAYLASGLFVQADSEFDRCLQRRGEALSLFLNEEPTFGYFPPVYYFQGRVREALKADGFAESYRAYLQIREKSGEDPRIPEVRQRAGAR